MKLTHKIAYTLIIIGALNWGLVGLFSIDLVEYLFDSVPMISRLVYLTVGLSAIYLLIDMCMCCFKHNTTCCCDGDCKKESESKINI